MAEQKSNPSATKSHHNDSESQIKKSMSGQQPNTAPDASKPDYVVEGNGPYRVVDKRTNSIAGESGDQEEANKLMEQLKKANEGDPQTIEGASAGSNPQDQPSVKPT